MPRDGYASIAQEDFSAGAYPGHEVVPANGAEDIVDGVLAEDGSVFTRGGSSYVGTLAATNTQPFYNLWAGYLRTVGKLVIASKAQGTTVISQGFRGMIGTATDFSGGFNDALELAPQRAVEFNGMVVFVGPVNFGPGVRVGAWGGATAGLVSGQSVTVVEGSKLVIGTGTNFTAAAPGMILTSGSWADQVAVIESVQNNTALTLVNPWPSAGAVVTADINPSVSLTTAEVPLAGTLGGAYAATIFDRLVYARGGRIAFTRALNPFGVDNDNYHELPAGVAIGLEPLRDQMLVFSTRGVYAISGMGYDLTDDFGNPQQRLERVAPEVVLWDDRGIAGWRGALVVPCVDDVYLFDSAASLRPIGGGMRKQYRYWVQQGFQAGQATVFDGRYLLPIVNGKDWVDTLVCDLRTGAWTRWQGNGAAAVAFTTLIGDDAREPRLFALGASGSSRRVHELSAVFDQDAAGDSVDADGSTVRLKVTTRTLSVPRAEVAQTWRKFRARWELSGSPTVTLERSEGKPDASFTTISSPQVRSDDDESVYTWPFTERSRSIRYRVIVYGSSSRATLRAFDTSFRQSGKP